MRIEIPELCLVVLIGPAGAGKSTFARARFRPTEVISSDACRALVADREDDLSATPAAFQVLHLIASLRLRRRRLTVVDAVNAKPEDRRPLLDLARDHDCAAVALVLNLPREVCEMRDRERPGRTVGSRAIEAQWESVQRSLPALGEEGFNAVHVLSSTEDVEAAMVRRAPLPVNRRWERGPFDVIGDVEGRLGALVELLERLGYPREDRRAVFTGDLGGEEVMRLVETTSSLVVRGDRDDNERSPSHLVLAGGRLVVAHAGIRSEYVGRDSPRVTRFCLTAEPGWAQAYRGRTLVVHGHEPVPCPTWQGHTVNLHTTGALTALRYPELETVSIPVEP